MKKHLSFAAIVLVALIYAGCKKSNNTPNTSTANDSKVSLMVAQNLVNMLDGGFGFDPTTGAPTGNSAPKRKVYSQSSSGCGISYDTTLNYTYKLDTLSETIKGNFGVSFNGCGSDFSLGINANYTLGLSTPSLSGNYKMNEDLTFSASADGDNAVFNGTVGIDAALNYLKGSNGSSDQTYNYNFKSITEDSNGDIISGSASFTTTGSGSVGTWNYSGTITFTGNNKAVIKLGSKTYNVNLSTGVVTAA